MEDTLLISSNGIEKYVTKLSWKRCDKWVGIAFEG